MCPSFPSRHFCTRPVPHHPDLQRQFRHAQEAGGYPQAHPPVTGGSLVVWPSPPQTQVMSPTSPTSPIKRIWSTIRSTSPTTTQISGAQTTSPWFPTVQEVCRIRSIKQQPWSRSKVSFLFGHTTSQVTGVGHVSSRSSHRETEAELDWESVATTLVCSQSKGKRDRELKFVRALRDRDNLQKILDGKVDLGIQGERCSGWGGDWDEELGKAIIGIILCRRSINNLNLSGFDGSLDASEIHPRRISAKEGVDIIKERGFLFPAADGTAKLSGREHEFRVPTPRREQTVRSEELSGGDSRRTGRASTDGIERWRWSLCRLLVDSRWLHLSSS